MGIILSIIGKYLSTVKSIIGKKLSIIGRGLLYRFPPSLQVPTIIERGGDGEGEMDGWMERLDVTEM